MFVTFAVLGTNHTASFLIPPSRVRLSWEPRDEDAGAPGLGLGSLSRRQRPTLRRFTPTALAFGSAGAIVSSALSLPVCPKI